MLIQQLVLFKKGDVNIAQQEVLTGLKKGNPFDFRKLFVLKSNCMQVIWSPNWKIWIQKIENLSEI